VFLLMMIGYGSRKAGFLKSGDAALLNSLVINLMMPAYIFVSANQQPLTGEMFAGPVVGLAMTGVVLGLAYAAARILRLDRGTTGALMLVSAFGNTGFLGYPVVQAAFGREAVLPAVLYDQFGMTILMNTVGVAVAASFAGAEFEWGSVLEFLKTPLFAATVIALVLRETHIPEIIMTTLNYLAAATVPLAMISIGLNLSTGAVRKYPLPLAVGTLLKMAVLPALLWAALPLVGVSGMPYRVNVLESAMPAAVLTGVIAGRYGANAPFAAGAVFVMHMLSVIVLPAVIAVV
jgi:predicted permease